MLDWDSFSDSKNQPGKPQSGLKAEQHTEKAAQINEVDVVPEVTTSPVASQPNVEESPTHQEIPSEHKLDLPKANESLEPVRVEDKRVVNGLSDVNQLAPFKYPWAWEYFLNANKNHWTPQDIDLKQDNEDFKHTLNDSERHVYTNVLAFLTTSDIIAMRNIGLAVMEKMSAPELQIYQARHMYEASLHTWAYQHCLESLGLDQSDIYNRYRVAPAINKKIQVINRRLNSILRTDIDLNDPTELNNFVMAYLFFSAVFEGTWLYNGFAPIFAMQRRGLMKGTSELLQYIMRDVSMHTGFGIQVVSQIIKENNLQLDVQAINQMWQEAEACETAYARFLLENSLQDYSAEEHIQQYRFIANRRAQQLGLEQPYPNATCAFPWMDEMANVGNEENFSDSQVTSHATGGGLSWD
jgi:ribonucleoside-diphosphate reductase beta chain